MERSEMSKHVSQRIRHFRKLHNMTLDELAKRIYKSKSTLSKYENGEIIIDVATLQDISNVLDIPIVSFFSTQPLAELPSIENVALPGTGLQTTYIYHWDARPHRRSIYQSVVQVDPVSERCHLYWAVPDVDEFTKCNYMFYGRCLKTATSNRLLLLNYTNQMDMLIINYLDPLTCHNNRVTGSLTSMSVGQYECYSTKCIISDRPLEQNDELIQALLISKQAISDIKKTNVFRMNYI